MNRVILGILLLLITLTASAQYGGDWVVGGRVNYVGGGKIVTPDRGRVNTGFTLKVAPSLAYFIRNGIALGVITSYEFMKDSQGHQHTGEVLPFLRYDVGGGSVRFFMQLESGCGWGKSRMKDGADGKHFLWTTNLKPGLFIRITDHWAAEATFSCLQYKHVKATDLDSGESVVRDKWDFTWLDISFGVAAILKL